jgi:hypothetical protein
MTPRNLKQLLAVMTVVCAVGVAAPPAHASGELRVVVDGGGPLVDLTRLAPGATRQSTFSAFNTSGDDAVLALRVVDLREDDNGCLRPETAYGDVTCGEGGGELGRDLTVAVVPLGVDGSPGEAVFDGSVRELVAWTVADQRLAAGAERSFRLDWELPFSSPNDTQTDRVAFDVEFILEQAIGTGEEVVVERVGTPADTEVSGTHFGPAPLEPTGAPTRVLGALPATGAGPFKQIELAAMALVAGGLLLAITRRRRRAGS